MPFNFQYAVNDVETANDYTHNAVSDGDVTRGEYRVQLPDGRTQIVKYTADWKNGYNAVVMQCLTTIIINYLFQFLFELSVKYKFSITFRYHTKVKLATRTTIMPIRDINTNATTPISCLLYFRETIIN